jgi:hypothetical protein
MVYCSDVVGMVDAAEKAQFAHNGREGSLVENDVGVRGKGLHERGREWPESGAGRDKRWR